MQLDKETIDEFKRIYFHKFGKQLSDSQAIEYGTRLIKLVKAVYGQNLPPLSIDNKIKKRNN